MAMSSLNISLPEPLKDYVNRAFRAAITGPPVSMCAS